MQTCFVHSSEALRFPNPTTKRMISAGQLQASKGDLADGVRSLLPDSRSIQHKESGQRKAMMSRNSYV